MADSRSGRRMTPVREVARKSADERWADILEVSARMFAKNGYSATSLQHIAEDLGILKGSLYYYINSKDDLLYEVIRTVYVTGVENFRANAGAEAPAVERLWKAIAGHIVYLVHNLTATTVFLHEYERLSPERKAELAYFDYAAELKRLIIEGQREGSLRSDLDPTLAALSALGSANWVYRWYHDGSAKPEEIGRHFADLAVCGMLTGGVRMVDGVLTS